MVKRRKKTEVEEVIEFLKSQGAVEITKKNIENNPALKKRIEADEERFQEYPKFIKKTKLSRRVAQ
jgi:hypothetical protein